MRKLFRFVGAIGVFLLLAEYHVQKQDERGFLAARAGQFQQDIGKAEWQAFRSGLHGFQYGGTWEVPISTIPIQKIWGNVRSIGRRLRGSVKDATPEKKKAARTARSHVDH